MYKLKKFATLGLFLSVAALAQAAVYSINTNGSSDYKPAIDAVIGGLADGDEIRFGPGQFPVSGALAAITKNVTIRGQGDNATALVQTSAGASLLQFNYATNKSAVISDLSLETTVNADAALLFTSAYSNSGGAQLEAVRVHVAESGDSAGGPRIGRWNRGLVLTNAWNSTVRDCHFSNPGSNYSGTGLQIAGVSRSITVYNTGFSFWQRGAEILSNGSAGSYGIKFSTCTFVAVSRGISYEGDLAHRPQNVAVQRTHIDLRGGNGNLGLFFNQVQDLEVNACYIITVFGPSDPNMSAYHLAARATTALVEDNIFLSTWGVKEVEGPSGGTGGGVVFMEGSSNVTSNANAFHFIRNGQPSLWVQSGVSGATATSNLFHACDWPTHFESSTTQANN